ncbi:MAG: amidohydrolase [Bacteroidetes bacterium]|nr:amidohydrolase [Bacteroidota bacterium]
MVKTPVRLFVAFVVSLIGWTIYYVMTMSEPADILFINARIHTMDAQMSVADAIAVRGERIVAVGSRSRVEARVDADTLIDLGGRTVLPGFIDAHGHLLSLGLARMTVDLIGASSEEAAAERVRARVSAVSEGQWIRGRGWDQNDWPSKRFPARSVLDRAAPLNPVYLARVDGHAAWVNGEALKAAGITRTTQDPPGGKILRRENGEPSGILVDAAMELVQRVMPQPSDEEMRQALRLATSELTSLGVTGMHDMGVDLRTIALYKDLIDKGDFPLRVYALVDGPGETWDSIRASGPILDYGDRLTVRGIKLYADGALGSRGAAMIEPYDDDPGNRGLTMADEATLQAIVDDAVDRGFQVCTHAIGDRGNSLTLDLYARALANVANGDRRLRVEHAQILHPSDIPRFAELGVIPSMQPTHCTSDMYWAEARVGPGRVNGAYAWRSLLHTGVIIPCGSDFPVEHPDPIAGIAAAVTRRDARGVPASQQDINDQFQLADASRPAPERYSEGWYGGQRMTLVEAIRGFSAWGAYAAFEEGKKGTLEPGKLADFIVLGEDPFRMPVGEVSTRVR